MTSLSMKTQELRYAYILAAYLRGPYDNQEIKPLRLVKHTGEWQLQYENEISERAEKSIAAASEVD